MQTKLVSIAAGALLFASQASVAAPQAPYALRAIHADLQEQLDAACNAAGPVGDAARTAASLLASHNAAQEQAATAQRDGAQELMTALVELYAIADETGHGDIRRVAERLIWHETADAEILATAANYQYMANGPSTADASAGPLYGPHPTPMMGIGNPHKAGIAR